ncbi:carboxyvinyl-carboxyphosphonate phosphorylmutase [Amycolatopsis bartoniae]|uniref:2-methylisocitrate lyase n=1 Tax=Amycolatopsis bartoniae TaxID=941986 RepID=A0A8H9IU42_9PSEU|nr:oxaloacetate decarboxylase [Amycolatopsis bartoniae]MBB2935634.1 carboxyvinyl-carboxyphosphonate phosphorylmutase [Amycolatopsis bartoniae]TVT02084.1 oxaloacetate decarboxylase [Amycolatopsis bartoniae]GHF60763.1 isocitrate lyase-family enzyme [Amycolatopsis bartoniae]
MSDFLSRGNAGPTRLRELLAGSEPVLAPGAYDALSARLAEEAGFQTVYMTGFGVTASLLGRPDVGLLTMTEMVDTARRITSAVDVPVLADADTGYGNALNVIRTVQEYERAGVAGIHLEDQISPKRCGHMTGKQVVPADTAVDKIRAAVAARRDPDFVLVARTDARAVEGVDAAIERAHRYRDAGADALFVEALETEAEIERVATEFAGFPLLFNWVEGGKTPPVDLEHLRELGFRLVICPISGLLAATRALRNVYGRIAADGTPIEAMTDLPSFGEFTDLIGLPEVTELGQRFGLG